MKIFRNILIFISCCAAGMILWRFWNYIQGAGDEVSQSQTVIGAGYYLDTITGYIGLILIVILAGIFVIACIVNSRSKG